MKSYRFLACLSVVFTLSLPPASLAAAAVVSTVPQATGTFAGKFAGDWLGDDGTGGALKLTVKSGKESAWTIEASFTLDGANVLTTTKTLQFDGNKIEMVFAWELQGTAASTKLVGELKGDQIAGTYESTTAEGVEKGKWKVTRKP
ncbi:MAG: hypothetical protein RL077_475 [Verrucomicrobiota bacterium]|jgi:hypothetical protein